MSPARGPAVAGAAAVEHQMQNRGPGLPAVCGHGQMLAALARGSTAVIKAAAAVQCPPAATYAAAAGCFLCQAQDLVDTAKALPA